MIETNVGMRRFNWIFSEDLLSKFEMTTAELDENQIIKKFGEGEPILKNALESNHCPILFNSAQFFDFK